MKKLLSLLLSLTLVFAMAGCGEEQSATYSLTTEQEGLTMTDTQIIKAKGDIVYALDETTVFDLTSTDAEAKELIIAYYDETFATMKTEAPASVTMDYSLDGDIYTAQISINLEGADLQELIAGGYIVASSENADKMKIISFKQTCDGLESAGYVLQ